MDAHRVSIMMPAYNASRYIGEAIQSVLAQAWQDWELVIVNDGSTDDTAAIVSRFSDPRIRLINKQNGGESSARNAALDHSKGEFIAYLDADDAWLPHHLSATISYLLANPLCDAVYTDGFHIDEAGRRITTLQQRRRGPFEGNLFEQVVLASDVFGPPSCVVLRHRLVSGHHLRYDTRIVIGPDWDFFTRFSEFAVFGYVPDHSCLYRVHNANITVQIDARRRAGFLAMCREKAITLRSFARCSPETRTAVFYDLLVNLLAGQPDRQAKIIDAPEFSDLPDSAQARLLRRVASETIRNGAGVNADLFEVQCIARARALQPVDFRTWVLGSMYRLSPGLCQVLLRTRSPIGRATALDAPFADLARGSASRQ